MQRFENVIITFTKLTYSFTNMWPNLSLIVWRWCTGLDGVKQWWWCYVMACIGVGKVK